MRTDWMLGFFVALVVTGGSAFGRGKLGSNWKPESAAAARARSKIRGTKVTLHKGSSMTTGGNRYVYKGKKDSNGTPLYQYDGPAKSKSSSSKRSSSRTTRRTLGSSRSRSRASAGRTVRPPVQAPWAERLKTSRTRLEAAGATALPGELSSGDDAHTFAALERAYKLKVSLPERDLATALGSVRDAKAAHAAAYHLSRHDTPTARSALARHVARGRPGSDQVEKFLGAEGPQLVAAEKVRLAKREGWMNDAATGRPGSRSQLKAIQGLTNEPGGDVSALLRQLAGDQNESVAVPAAAALEKRKQSGL